MIDLDEINPLSFMFALVVTAFMVWTMFFMNPENWAVIPTYLRVIVAIASFPLVYVVTEYQMNK